MDLSCIRRKASASSIASDSVLFACVYKRKNVTWTAQQKEQVSLSSGSRPIRITQPIRNPMSPAAQQLPAPTLLIPHILVSGRQPAESILDSRDTTFCTLDNSVDASLFLLPSSTSLQVYFRQENCKVVTVFRQEKVWNWEDAGHLDQDIAYTIRVRL